MLTTGSNTMKSRDAGQNVVDVVYSNLAFGVMENNFDNFSVINQNIDQFFAVLSAFINDPVVTFSSAKKGEESIKLLSTTRDFLTICGDASLPHVGKAACESFKKQLYLFKFVAKVVECLGKTSGTQEKLLTGKNLDSGVSNTEHSDYLAQLQLLLSHCVFQYLNISFENLEDAELTSLIGAAFNSELSEKVSFLLLLALVSYVDRTKQNISGLVIQHQSKSAFAKEALLFGTFCMLEKESECERYLNDNMLDYFHLQTTQIVTEIVEHRHEFYRYSLHVIKLIFTKLILNLSRLIRKIRISAESGESQKKDSFRNILLILATCYSNAPDDALEFWEADGRFVAFLRWSSDCSVPSVITAFLQLLSAISTGNECCKLAFEMITNGSFGIFNWNPFFDSLENYSTALSDTSHTFDINPQEYLVLLHFLNLASTHAKQLEACRTLLFQPRNLNTLITLLCCKIPIDMKAKILNLLSNFALDSNKATIIYSFLQKSQILNSIIGEIQQIEAKQSTWTETLSFLDLCTSLASIDPTLCNLVMDKIFLPLSTRSFLSLNGLLQVASKCLQLFTASSSSSSSSSNDIFSLFISNSFGCSDFLLQLVGNEKLTRQTIQSESFRECLFYCLKLFKNILDSNSDFVNILFGRNLLLTQIFSYLDEFYSSSLSVYMLDIVSLICSYGHLSKLSQLFFNNDQIQNGFYLILTTDGPTTDKYPMQYDDQTDFSYQSKQKLISLLQRQTANVQDGNYFFTLFTSSDLFLKSLCDIFKNSPHPVMVESSLEVLLNILKIQIDPIGRENIFRYLRSTEKIFNFLVKSLSSISSSSSSQFTTRSYGLILQLLAYDVLSMYQLKLSVNLFFTSISLADLDNLLLNHFEDPFIMSSFEFFFNVIFNCSQQQNKQFFFDQFIKNELFDRLFQIVIQVESQQIIENCCNCFFISSRLLVDEKHFEKICSLFSQGGGKLNTQSRISLYSSLANISNSKRKDSCLKASNDSAQLSLPADVLTSIFSDIFSNETIQIVSMSTLSLFLNCNIVNQLYRNGHLTKLISNCFSIGQTSQILSDVFCSFFASFCSIVSCAERIESFDLLIESGFLDSFFSNVTLLKFNFPYLSEIVSQCLLTIPKYSCTVKSKSINDKLFTLLTEQINNCLEKKLFNQLSSLVNLIVSISCSTGEKEISLSYDSLINKIYTLVFFNSYFVDEELLSGILMFYENKLIN